MAAIGIVEQSNSTTTALGANETFTGVGVDVSQYSSVIVALKTDQACTIYIEFSVDRENWDSSISLSVAASVNEVHIFKITRKYFRLRIVNSTASQSYLRASVMLGHQSSLTSALNSTIQADADAMVVRPANTNLDVVRSLVTGQAPFNKFGRNEAVGTTIEPISQGGVYQTPTALTTLEILSSSASDTSAGVGGRTVVIIGIGANYEEVTHTATLNGTSVVSISTQFYRVYRMYVATSGTYGSSTAGSHVGTITLRTAGGGVSWAIIGVIDGLGRGQSQIASYTVPAGKTLYVYEFDFSVESSKAITLLLFQRRSIDTIAAPFDTMRVVREYNLLSNTHHVNMNYPLVFPEKTDVGFMGETASGTGSVSIQIDGILVTN